MMKPRITFVMAMSLDGKISLATGERLKFSSKEDKKLLERLRRESDCIVRGANTVRLSGAPVVIKSAEGKSKKSPLNVVVCRDLKFDYNSLPFFTSRKTKKIILTSDQDPRKLNEAEKYAKVVQFNPGGGFIDANKVIHFLTQLPCKRILVEGGGELNYYLLKRGLGDELYLTIRPLIMGGRENPNLVGGDGFNAFNIKRLVLLDVRKGEKGEVFLHYTFSPRKPHVFPIRNGWVVR